MNSDTDSILNSLSRARVKVKCGPKTDFIKSAFQLPFYERISVAELNEIPIEKGRAKKKRKDVEFLYKLNSNSLQISL